MSGPYREPGRVSDEDVVRFVDRFVDRAMPWLLLVSVAGATFGIGAMVGHDTSAPSWADVCTSLCGEGRVVKASVSACECDTRDEMEGKR